MCSVYKIHLKTLEITFILRIVYYVYININLKSVHNVCTQI